MSDEKVGMFDEKSYELAEYFLADRSHTSENLKELAYAIQNSVEDYFRSLDEVEEKSSRS